jgi:hypothetical protein
VAQAVRADGVHLGQKDMPLKMARQIVGDSMIIGISAESLEHAIAAENGGADYSPVFATFTKTDTAPAIELEVRDTVKLPLVGIGGIHSENAETVIQSGADGVAVVSAIVSADDPQAKVLTDHCRVGRRRRCRCPGRSGQSILLKSGHFEDKNATDLLFLTSEDRFVTLKENRRLAIIMARVVLCPLRLPRFLQREMISKQP